MSQKAVERRRAILKGILGAALAVGGMYETNYISGWGNYILARAALGAAGGLAAARVGTADSATDRPFALGFAIGYASYKGAEAYRLGRTVDRYLRYPTMTPSQLGLRYTPAAGHSSIIWNYGSITYTP